MKHLVIGYKGQIGAAIFEILKKASYDVSGIDLNETYLPLLPGKFEVVHVCIPYSEKFAAIVMDYVCQDLVLDGLLIIHSTVPVGTSARLGAVHSPVRGIHPNLVEGIRTFVKFFGGPRAQEAARIFWSVGINCYCTDKAETTEALKLWDTTYYGWNIVFEKAVRAYCDEHGLDFDVVYGEGNRTYNFGYTKLGMPHVVRPVLKDCPGEIGGHCVIPNCHVLGGEIADFILRANEKF